MPPVENGGRGGAGDPVALLQNRNYVGWTTTAVSFADDVSHESIIVALARTDFRLGPIPEFGSGALGRFLLPVVLPIRYLI